MASPRAGGGIEEEHLPGSGGGFKPPKEGQEGVKGCKRVEQDLITKGSTPNEGVGLHLEGSGRC